MTDTITTQNPGFPYTADNELKLDSSLLSGDRTRFTTNLERFLTRWGRATEVEPEILKGAIDTEIKFTHRVLEACEKWNAQGAGILFWDVDDTQGIGVRLPGSRQSEWMTRPSMPFLATYIKAEFENLSHGILSFRSKETLDKDASPDGRLRTYSGFFDTNRIFSLDEMPPSENGAPRPQYGKEFSPRAVKKLSGFMTLGQQVAPLNSYLIDDYSLPPAEGTVGRILCVGDLLPKNSIAAFSDAVIGQNKQTPVPHHLVEEIFTRDR